MTQARCDALPEILNSAVTFLWHPCHRRRRQNGLETAGQTNLSVLVDVRGPAVINRGRQSGLWRLKLVLRPRPRLAMTSSVPLNEIFDIVSPHKPKFLIFDYQFLLQSSFETVAESPVSYITTAYLLTDRPSSLLAIKTASTLREYSGQPHDIRKELRILSSLSHPNVCPGSHCSDGTALTWTTHRLSPS